MKAKVEELKRQILSKYKSIHAFCRSNPELKRSTVYHVLAGKYSGETLVQLNVIKAVLEGVSEIRFAPCGKAQVTELETYNILQETKCAHCRKFDKRACQSCRAQTELEAVALTAYWLSREA